MLNQSTQVSVAQFEREMMLERQREGIAKAKSEGKYRGRKPTARAKAGEVRKLLAAGLSATKIAEQLKIGRASVYRVALSSPSETPGDSIIQRTIGS